MIAVGPGFDRGNHEGATSAAELRGSYASLHTELVNGLGRREEDDRVDQGFVIVDAIENEIVILGPQAIHCQSGAPLLPKAKGFGVVVCTGGRAGGVTACNARHEEGELREVTAVQGHLRYLAAFDDFSNGGVLSIKDGGTSVDRNCLGHFADIQAEIRDGNLGDLELEGAGNFLETFFGDLHAVVSWRQRGYRVIAEVIGGDVCLTAGVDIRDGDSGTYERCARGVSDCALETGGIDLSESDLRRSGKEKRKEHAGKKEESFHRNDFLSGSKLERLPHAISDHRLVRPRGACCPGRLKRMDGRTQSTRRKTFVIASERNDTKGPRPCF